MIDKKSEEIEWKSKSENKLSAKFIEYTKLAITFIISLSLNHSSSYNKIIMPFASAKKIENQKEPQKPRMYKQIYLIT